MKTKYFESAEVSDVGRKRKNNEDDYLSIPERGIYCVADGMGGQAGGDLASEAITTTLQQVFAKATPEEDATFACRIELFTKATNQASKWIKNFADEKVIGQMGSTVVALVIDPRNPTRAVGLHAGDSRLYRYRNGKLKQITTDHSALAAIAAKLGISPESVPAKYQNELMRAVGLSEVVELEKTPVDIVSGDVYLICSDGLTKMQSDEQIAKIIKDGATDPIATVAQKLINATNEAGGRDNVTVILVKAGDLSDAQNLIAPHDEDEEDRTIAAPPQAEHDETPTLANSPLPDSPLPDTADVHGDTPSTPHTENITPEKAIAEKPLPPVPVPILISKPTPTPTQITTPTPKAVKENPSTPKEVKLKIKPQPEPARKNKFPLISVVVIATFIFIGVGIWFAFSAKPKTARPIVALQSQTLVTNAPITKSAPDQAESLKRAAYTKAITGARAALAGGDYTNALAGAMAALQQLPADASASQLRDSAQKQLILYHDAVNAANAAWQKSDFAAVVADADQALAVYPNNTAMQQLKASAQAQIANQQAYAKAISNARVALDNHDYKTAVAWATAALDKIHGDAQATKIRDSAQQQLSAGEELDRKYQLALKDAQAALKKNNFSESTGKAMEALAIRPNDPAANQIIRQIQLAVDDESVRTFFEQGDYNAALKICQSHTSVDGFNQLAAKCRAEQAVLDDAKSLLNTGDYSFSPRIQGQTYARKEPFVELLNQAAVEQNLLTDLASLKAAGNWQAVASKLARPTPPTVTNKPPFRALSQWAKTESDQAEKQKRSQQTIVTFEKMLVWFNVMNPTDTYLHTAEARKQEPVNGALSGQQRQSYLDTAAWLENEFNKNGILNQNDRAKYLKELKDTIAHHE